MSIHIRFGNRFERGDSTANDRGYKIHWKKIQALNSSKAAALRDRNRKLKTLKSTEDIHTNALQLDNTKFS